MMQHLSARGARAVVFSACLVAAVQPATAQDSEETYFKGKTIKMVVGYSPGGGYDAYARLISPHLGKALGATVVVENQPGAGGVTALNRIAASPPDGLQMMIVNGTGAALAQLSDQSGVRYDLATLDHLGTVSASPWVWLVAPGSPIKTPQDAMKPGVKIAWAGSGPADGLTDGAAFTCEALQLNCQIVIGYKGSNDAGLAVQRGEMDAIYVSDTSANNYVRSGQNRAVATMGRKKSRFFPEVPTIFEAVKLSPDGQWIFDFRATIEDLGRILVTAPNTPPARLAYLQASMKKVLSDPVVVAEGEKTQRYVEYVDAEPTRQSVIKVVRLSPEQKKRVVDILSRALNEKK